MTNIELSDVELGAVSGGDYKISNWSNASTTSKVGAVANSVAAAVAIPMAAAPSFALAVVGLVAIAASPGQGHW
jgi:hypothetical protein